MARPSLPAAPAVFLALAAAVWSTCAGPAAANVAPFFDINPKWCPNTISRQEVDPRLAGSCEGVKLHPRMCPSCRMRKFDAEGNFPDNRDIYDLSSPECLSRLEEYARNNPCDEPRVAQIPVYAAGVRSGGSLSKEAFKAGKDLGEFMYNVCELCCDCIPIGAKPWHYSWRKNKLQWTGNFWSLIHVYRGNCPVHYYYDTCRMWPHLRDVARPWESLNLGLDKICPNHVYPWWNVKKYRVNWLANPRAIIPSWRFVNFLVKITNVLNCKDETLWKECARLEMAQQRI